MGLWNKPIKKQVLETLVNIEFNFLKTSAEKTVVKSLRHGILFNYEYRVSTPMARTRK